MHCHGCWAHAASSRRRGSKAGDMEGEAVLEDCSIDIVGDFESICWEVIQGCWNSPGVCSSSVRDICCQLLVEGFMRYLILRRTCYDGTERKGANGSSLQKCNCHRIGSSCEIRRLPNNIQCCPCRDRLILGGGSNRVKTCGLRRNDG